MTDQHQEARQTVSRAKSSEEFHAADDQAPDGRLVTEHGHYRFVPLVTD